MERGDIVKLIPSLEEIFTKDTGIENPLFIVEDLGYSITNIGVEELETGGYYSFYEDYLIVL